jgi:periplasmic protein CpxP/Spy
MDYFSKNKISVWIIAVLVLLNCFTLATIWLRQIPFPFIPAGEDPRPRRHGLNVLKEELNLSAEQISEFNLIRQRHFDKMRPLQNEIFSLRRELLDEIYKNEPDTQKVRLLAVRIGEKESERERFVFEHFMQMKSVCTPEQRDKYDRLLRELITPPDRGRRPGRPDGSRPHEHEFGYLPDCGPALLMDAAELFCE